jgi:hypothetical protein
MNFTDVVNRQKDAHLKGFTPPAVILPAVAEVIETTEKLFFESVGNDLMLESIIQSQDTFARAQALAGVLQFGEDGGNTAQELDDLIQGLAGVDDESNDVTDDEQDDYEQSGDDVAEALSYLGIDDATVSAALDDDNDDAAETIGMAIAKALDNIDDQKDYISRYSVRETLMTEATVKVVRGGQVIRKKKRLKKRKMSGPQKRALKMARRKAHSGKARKARKKSNKMRSSRGL